MPGRRQHGEGAFYQRGTRGGRKGQWVAVADLGWKGGRRDRREFTGGTAEEALAKRAEFLHKRRDGFTVPRGRPPTVAEWLLHWLHNTARDKVGETTWERSYRSKVTTLIAPYFEHVPLPDVDEEMIEAWHRHLSATVSARTGRPLSPATIGQCHRIMSAALKVAVTRRRIARNPCSNVTPPKDDEPDEMVPPDEDEVLAILRECEDRRTGPRWVAGIATGARQGEMLGLLWPHVDLDGPGGASVTVEWELVRMPWKHGCADPHACGGRLHRFPCPVPCPKAARTAGRRHSCRLPGDESCCPLECTAHASRCPVRTGGLKLKRPKSAASRRVIPLAPYAAASLRQWRTDQKAERLAHPAWKGWAHDPQACGRKPRPGQHVCPGCRKPVQPGALVFARPDGTPTDGRADWADWSELLEDAGLPHFRTHDNRHGYATLLLEGGTDIRVVQELMGHASPDFTRRAYQHVRARLRQEAADTIERALRRGR